MKQLKSSLAQNRQPILQMTNIGEQLPEAVKTMKSNALGLRKVLRQIREIGHHRFVPNPKAIRESIDRHSRIGTRQRVHGVVQLMNVVRVQNALTIDVHVFTRYRLLNSTKVNGHFNVTNARRVYDVLSEVIEVEILRSKISILHK